MNDIALECDRNASTYPENAYLRSVAPQISWKLGGTRLTSTLDRLANQGGGIGRFVFFVPIQIHCSCQAVTTRVFLQTLYLGSTAA